jgi:hypothetical protein
MNISKAAISFLVGAAVAVGAVGAYVGMSPAAPSAVTAAQPDSVSSTAPTSGPVEQSETVVTDVPEPAQVAAAPAASAPRINPIKPAARPVERPRNEVARAVPAPAPAVPHVTESPRSPALVPEAVEPPRIVDNQASRTVEPVGPLFDELVVAADSVIGLEIESAISTERAKVEDPVVARVTRDVRVGSRVAIPAGSRANGEVTTVERGGRLKERARLGVRFTSIVLADGTRVPIQTETIYREGDSPTNESAAKIGGGAIGGAIIGGILGGGKGAAIGSIVGAGAGSGAVAAGGRNAATLPSGTPVTVRVHEPVVVTVER